MPCRELMTYYMDISTARTPGLGAGCWVVHSDASLVEITQAPERSDKTASFLNDSLLIITDHLFFRDGFGWELASRSSDEVADMDRAKRPR